MHPARVLQPPFERGALRRNTLVVGADSVPHHSRVAIEIDAGVDRVWWLRYPDEEETSPRGIVQCRPRDTAPIRELHAVGRHGLIRQRLLRARDQDAEIGSVGDCGVERRWWRAQELCRLLHAAEAREAFRCDEQPRMR